MENSKVVFLKSLYLYLVSFVALMMVVFPAADLINTTLRTYVFTKADYFTYYGPEMQCPSDPVTKDPTTGQDVPPKCITKEEMEKRNRDEQAAQRQRDLVRDISYILVGLPLFIFHWHLARKKEV